MDKSINHRLLALCALRSGVPSLLRTITCSNACCRVALVAARSRRSLYFGIGQDDLGNPSMRLHSRDLCLLCNVATFVRMTDWSFCCSCSPLFTLEIILCSCPTECLAGASGSSSSFHYPLPSLNIAHARRHSIDIHHLNPCFFSVNLWYIAC